MRYDHITILNEQMEAACVTTDQTLMTLRGQRKQLDELVAEANDVVHAIDGQIEQLERLRNVVGQLASAEAPLPPASIQNKLKEALKAVDRQERTVKAT